MLNPKIFPPAFFFLPCVGFYSKAGNKGHIPSEESTGCDISGKDGCVLGAASSKSPCHRAGETHRLVCHQLCQGVSAGGLHRVDVPGGVISPGEHLAAVQAPPRSPVPVISWGFASTGWAQPAHGGGAAEKAQSRGDSARQPLSQLRQGLPQCLHALLGVDIN